MLGGGILIAGFLINVRGQLLDSGFITLFFVVLFMMFSMLGNNEHYGE